MPYPPITAMTASDAALALLKEFEQGPEGEFAPTPYLCPSGHKTIGWGHRIRPKEHFATPMTAALADSLLWQDVSAIAASLSDCLRVPVTKSMMDALCCFAFNVGLGAAVGSTLLWKLNRGDYLGAADELLNLDKARDPKTGKREILAGLTRRRQAERELFLRDGIPS